MRLPGIPVKGDERWGLLSKVIDKLKTRETKKALARNEITLNNTIKFLKIIILVIFFKLEISYAVSELNKRYELRKF